MTPLTFLAILIAYDAFKFLLSVVFRYAVFKNNEAVKKYEAKLKVADDYLNGAKL